MDTAPDCSPTFLNKWCTIGSTADSLGTDFYQQVLNMKSCQVASGGASLTALVAGAIGSELTLGLSAVIGIVVGAGGVITVASVMYNAWCAKKAANLNFDKMSALS